MSEKTGLYAGLLRTGSAPPSAGLGLPSADSLMKIRNAIWSKILPSGKLRTAMLSFDGSIVGAFNTLKSLLSSRKYTSNQYTLGERLIDQIQCSSNVGWKDVPDELVPIARLIFTMLFGVRIWEDYDLSALDNGVDAFLARPGKSDQNRKAVERAVFLKKTYFPASTYNNSCWDISIFDRYPLVAPVPAMNLGDNDEGGNIGKYYTGVGLNGQEFVNGLLAYNSPSTGLTQNLQNGKDLISVSSLQKNIPIIAILVVVGLYISLRTGLFKP